MHPRHKRKQVTAVRFFKKKPSQNGEVPAAETTSAAVSETGTKSWRNLLRNHRLPFIVALLLVVAVAVAAPLYIKYQNAKKTVTIGDTKITRADIDAYTKMVE